MDVSRRNLFRAAFATTVGVAAGTLAHGYGWERHAIGLTTTELVLSGLSPRLDGLRVGFLTDVHRSSIVAAEDVVRAVDLLARQQPDLIVLGGDFVSFGEREYAGPVAEIISTLRAEHGIFGVIGNHDHERAVASELRRVGVTMLLDARTALEIRGERLELAGVRFWTRSLHKIAEVVSGAQAPVLLLAHDPRRIVEAAALNVAGVLAGHTHGGQIVLPMVGAIAARRFPIAAGHLVRGATRMFVSRGVGTVVIPIRVNCPPEVALVTLRADNPHALG